MKQSDKKRHCWRGWKGRNADRKHIFEYCQNFIAYTNCRKLNPRKIWPVEQSIKTEQENLPKHFLSKPERCSNCSGNTKKFIFMILLQPLSNFFPLSLPPQDTFSNKFPFFFVFRLTSIKNIFLWLSITQFFFFVCINFHTGKKFLLRISNKPHREGFHSSPQHFKTNILNAAFYFLFSFARSLACKHFHG